MTLELYDFGDGGGDATKWRRKHDARRRAATAKKHRAEAAANKKREARDARADFKKRYAKWLKGWKRKCAAAKAAGRPKPRKLGQPWRVSSENFQVVDMVGRVYGRLTVIRSAPLSLTMRTSQRCRVCIVKCSCGSPERYVNGTSLRQGNSRSCGCMAREWGRKLGLAQRGTIKSKPLSEKLSIEAAKMRAAGNVRLARIFELSVGPVRVSERRRARRKRRAQKIAARR